MLKSKISPFFKNRRNKLIQQHPGSVFLLPSTRKFYRDPDGTVNQSFRQEANFFYLTGFEEEHSFCILSEKNGEQKLTSFVQERNLLAELWEGELYGVERSKQIFDADDVYPIQELSSKLPELIENTDKIFYKLGQSSSMDHMVLDAIQKANRKKGRTGLGTPPIQDPYAAIGELRLFKDAYEIECIRKACIASAMAHTEVLKYIKPGMSEKEVEGFFEYQIKKQDCSQVGYTSIIAGGKNAVCLHYKVNNERLNTNEVLLIDAGGEYEHYSADITRTFPIASSFTKAQKQMYQVVLNTQKECVSQVKPGMSFEKLTTLAIELLVDGMLEIELMKGSKSEIISKKLYTSYFPHGLGHWLGIDIHDTGYYGENKSRVFEPGMVLTIEAGLYVQAYDQQAPEQFKNIGIRIEDDILVTENGHENLTALTPVEIEEIESLRN